jgi:hypothetical protein
MRTPRPARTATPTAPATPGWRCEADETGIAARSASGTGAHVAVHDEDGGVRLEFWISDTVPRQVRSQLARQVFQHPALRPRRPVTAALPYGQTDVLEELRSHVTDTHTHVAGVTCLLEGRVR